MVQLEGATRPCFLDPVGGRSFAMVILISKRAFQKKRFGAVLAYFNELKRFQFFLAPSFRTKTTAVHARNEARARAIVLKARYKRASGVLSRYAHARHPTCTNLKPATTALSLRPPRSPHDAQGGSEGDQNGGFCCATEARVCVGGSQQKP
jgi:hypothetical protein